MPERLPSGLRRRSRKAVLPKGDVGSNPTLSASFKVITLISPNSCNYGESQNTLSRALRLENNTSPDFSLINLPSSIHFCLKEELSENFREKSYDQVYIASNETMTKECRKKLKKLREPRKR